MLKTAAIQLFLCHMFFSSQVTYSSAAKADDSCWTLICSCLYSARKTSSSNILLAPQTAKPAALALAQPAPAKPVPVLVQTSSNQPPTITAKPAAVAPAQPERAKPSPVLAQRRIGNFAMFTFLRAATCEEKQWDEMVANTKELSSFMQRTSQANVKAGTLVRNITQSLFNGYVIGKVEVTLKNKKKEAAQPSRPFAANSIILTLEDLQSADKRSVEMQHFSDLPNHFGQITDVFDKEQTEELLESIAKGMHAEKITSKVSLEVK